MDSIYTALEHQLLRAGLLHRDIRPPNVLWSAEREKYMVIDFERSQGLVFASSPRRHVLQSCSPNVRRHRSGKQPPEIVQPTGQNRSTLSLQYSRGSLYT